MTQNIEIETKDAKTFAEVVQNVEWASPLCFQLQRHFADEMYKAIEGRICTPERMALLYPIFREINIEQDEIKREFNAMERKNRQREAKRKGAQND